MDDPVWVNVYDRLVSEELMPEELVSQMRADGNSEMYIDAVLVEMEELARRGATTALFQTSKITVLMETRLSRTLTAV
jgi:hypothetical protein